MKEENSCCSAKVNINNGINAPIKETSVIEIVDDSTTCTIYDVFLYVFTKLSYDETGLLTLPVR